jgi:hypothetical protein
MICVRDNQENPFERLLMLDFAAVRNKQKTVATLAQGLRQNDLRQLTNEMVDMMLGLISGCVDADVIFTPVDPDARDDYAANSDEKDMAWTLGHVIVHTTSSAEESAFLAAELARGVEWHGRSRYEVPWREVTTIGQCRIRLEESRKMRLAMLESWPDDPHKENTYVPPNLAADVIIAPINCFDRFIRGLMHDDSHLAHIEEIVRQAKAARTT